MNNAKMRQHMGGLGSRSAHAVRDAEEWAEFRDMECADVTAAREALLAEQLAASEGEEPTTTQ